MEAVRRVLFGAMVMERILGMYVGCDQDRVWDTWDYLNEGYYLDDTWDYLDDFTDVTFSPSIGN